MLHLCSGNLRQTVYFHQGHARGTPTPGHNRGVAPGSKGHKDGRLQVVRRLEARRFNVRLLTLFPVIVVYEQRAVGVVQFENRIGQRVCHAKVGERGSDGAHKDIGILRLIGTEDKAANHDVVAGLDKPPGADVAKLRSDALIQVIGLDEADAGPTILAINDRSVEAGVEGCDDGRLQIVGRSQARCLDVHHLRGYPSSYHCS